MLSAVVLSMTCVELTEDALRARLDRAFPGEFLPARERGTFVVAGPMAGMQFLINSALAGAAGTFMLNSVPGPYDEFSDLIDHIDDARLKTLALAQQAWMSVDLVLKSAEPAGASRFIGKAIAELAPADAAVLVVSYDRAMCFDDGVRRQLATGGMLD